MTWITDYIALGGMYDSGHLDPRHMDLEGGVNAVLNMAEELPPDPATIRAFKITYLWLPIPDGQPVSNKILMKAFIFLSRCELEHKRVLVHCAAGISRSPSMVAMYLALRDGLTFWDALKIVKQKRPKVDPAASLARSAAIFVETHGQRKRTGE